MQVVGRLLHRTLHSAFSTWVEMSGHWQQKRRMMVAAAAKLRNVTCAKVNPQSSHLLGDPDHLLAAPLQRWLLTRQLASCQPANCQPTVQSSRMIALISYSGILLAVGLESSSSADHYPHFVERPAQPTAETGCERGGLFYELHCAQAFATMREYARGKAQARCSMGRALQLLAHALPSKAWRTWAAHVQQRRDLRRKAAAVVAVMMHGDLHRSWAAWQARLQARRAKTAQVPSSFLPSTPGLGCPRQGSLAQTTVEVFLSQLWEGVCYRVLLAPRRATTDFRVKLLRRGVAAGTDGHADPA